MTHWRVGKSRMRVTDARKYGTVMDDKNISVSCLSCLFPLKE